MEVSNSNQGLVGTLSPSRITDYFNSSKSKTKGARKYAKTKEPPVSTTSIYLTPESSPGNDLNLDIDEITSNKNPAPLQEFCRNTDSLKVDISDEVASIESDVSLHSLISTLPNLRDNCEASFSHPVNENPNLFSIKPEEAPSSDAPEFGNENTEEGLPNPASSQSKKKSTNGNGKNPSTAITSNEASISSPSLPRPKMRKGVKSKSKSDSLATTHGEPIKPKPGRRKKKEPEPIQKNVITDFFPVRRSGRLTKSEIEKEKHHQLEEQLMSKCEDGLQVVEFECKGRGVITTKDFSKGDFVVEYAGDLIDTVTAKKREEDYAANPQIGCYMYFFSIGTKQCCVDATAESGRLGRLINHSREGNCCTKAVMVQDKPRLILVASKDIKSGEELSYDYGDRSKAALEAHPWLKS